VLARGKKQTLLARAQNFIWPNMGLRRAWTLLVHRMARLSVGPHAIALGFAAGAFVSCTPFIGFHFILAGFLAFTLRASILASAIGTVVGNPLTFPFIWLAAYNLGAALLGRAAKAELLIDLPSNSGGIANEGFLVQVPMLWRIIEPVFLPLVIGGIPIGLVCAVPC
jgi:uncharacterized protein (DUF2062 family)